MESGVLYLLHGTKLAARLVVSVASLRKFYRGPVAVVTTDSSACALAERICEDERLQLVHVPVVPNVVPDRHAGYLFKTRLHEYTPFEATAFLDCDTLVRGSIDTLFQLPTRRHVLVTQFCKWRTESGIIARRIKGWKSLFPGLIDAALRYGRAVNTGVFSFTRTSEVFERWYDIAYAGREQFIPDEIAMQLLLPSIPAEMLSDEYNCSAKFGDTKAPSTRIIHFHGRRHVGGYGQLWLDAYHTAFAVNYGRIRQWTPAGDRCLRRHLNCQPT